MDYGDFDFLQAFVKRGFVNIPRLLIDYTPDLGLDYGTIGRIVALMACVGGPQESAFETYRISRQASAGDFDQICGLVADLEQKELVVSNQVGDEITFSFAPLLFSLRAIWGHYREQQDTTPDPPKIHPAIAAAEQFLGRTLSDRDVKDIQDWIVTYKYDTDMVIAICKQGKGNTRINYLNQIARSWFEEGIRTPEDAEVHSARHRKTTARHRSIIQYLGIKHNLTGAEQALLDKWTDEWAFSNEIIIRACMESTGSKNPMQYINRVLESWVEQGVRTVEDVEKVLSEHKRKAATGDGSQPPKARRTPARSSTIFLNREKNDKEYYDHIYKRFDK